jgi:preprotein translocase SecF subunit
MRLIRETNFDFIGKRKWAFLISGAVIVPGLISILLRGGLRMGVDFTGGVEMQVEMVQPASAGAAAPIDIGNVRRAVAQAGYDDRNIQRIGARDKNLFLIHVQPKNIKESEATAAKATTDEILGKLKQDFPQTEVDLRGRQSIGPRIGAEMRGAAVQAVLLSMLLIMVYVGWRFEFRFGVATVVALFHDVIFCIGLFSLLNKEFTLNIVAALLTLAGYSVSDTIVVFDRIREELKLKQRRASYDEIFNHAINKTLSRTVLTSVTTLWAVIALFLFGGEVIHDFIWVLLVGIVVGTYSSIAVAAPLVIEWQHRVEARELARSGGVPAAAPPRKPVVEAKQG